MYNITYAVYHVFASAYVMRMLFMNSEVVSLKTHFGEQS